MDTEPEVSKRDDFFDDNEHAKYNGDVLPVTPDEKVKDEGDVTSLKDGGEEAKVNETSGDDGKQDPDAVAASGGEGGDGGDPAFITEGDEGSEPASGANQEEQVDGEPQAPSTEPSSDVPASQEGGEDVQGGEEEVHAEEEKTTKIQQEEDQEVEVNEQSEPEQDQVKDGRESVEAPPRSPEVEGQSEGQGDILVPEDDASKPAVEDVQKDDDGNDYEDSFSIASVDSTGKTMNAKIEDEKPESEVNEQTPMATDETTGGSSSPRPPSSSPKPKSPSPKPTSASPEPTAPSPKPRSPSPKQASPSPVPVSPTPSGESRAESRAEAGAVVPVVDQAEADQKADDGRSSVEAKDTENGEYRGEDRTEVNPPEGTEDSRGQGQWKTQEQQYVASAVLAQKSEHEALQELQEERDKLLDEQKDMKNTLGEIEAELSKKSDLLVAEKEINASRDKKIKALQEELVALYAKSGEGTDERTATRIARKIKDLQERMAVLARENEEKEDRIQRLNDELKTTMSKLKETEHRLAVSEQANANAGQAPKSKTCIIM